MKYTKRWLAATDQWAASRPKITNKVGLSDPHSYIEKKRKGAELMHRWVDYIHDPHSSIPVAYPDGTELVRPLTVQGTFTVPVGQGLISSGPDVYGPNPFVTSKNCITVFRPTTLGYSNSFYMGQLSIPRVAGADSVDPVVGGSSNFFAQYFAAASNISNDISALRPSFCKVHIEPVGRPDGAVGSVFICFPDSYEKPVSGTNRTQESFSNYFGTIAGPVASGATLVTRNGTLAPTCPVHIFSLSELYQKGGLDFTITDDLFYNKLFREAAQSGDQLNELDSSSFMTDRSAIKFWFDSNSDTDRVRIDITWGFDVKYRSHNANNSTIVHGGAPPHIPHSDHVQVPRAVNEHNTKNPTATPMQQARKVRQTVSQIYQMEQAAVKTARSAAKTAGRYIPETGVGIRRAAEAVAGVAGGLYGAYEAYKGTGSNSQSLPSTPNRVKGVFTKSGLKGNPYKSPPDRQINTRLANIAQRAKNIASTMAKLRKKY